jgi:peptidase S24-like protein
MTAPDQGASQRHPAKRRGRIGPPQRRLRQWDGVPVRDPRRRGRPGEDAEEVADLDQLKPEAIWAAPVEWRPNPAGATSFRVKGNSMSPLILDGYLIAVDTSETEHEKMLGQIVVAGNRDEKRLLVSRLIRSTTQTL